VNPLYRIAHTFGLKLVRDDADSASGAGSGGILLVSEHGDQVDTDKKRRAAASAAWNCANHTAMAAYHSFPSDQLLNTSLAHCGWTPKGSVDDVIDWMLTVDPQGFGMSLRGALPVHTYMWWGESDMMVVDQHPRGFAQVIDHFSADVLPPGDPRVVFGATVKKVDYASCGGVTVHTADGQQFTARHVVSTLPLGVLQHDHQNIFDPPLPSAQAAALEGSSIVMTNYTKIVAQWRDPFWQSAMGNASMMLAAGRDGEKGDLPLVRNMNAYINGSNALFVDVFEPQSSQFEAMSDEDAMAELLHRLSGLFPDAKIGKPTAFHMTRHGLDPLSRGAYTINNTHGEPFRAMTALLNDACGAPRVLWAGEAACDMLNGYAHGAYEAGQRAAGQILNLTGHGPAPPSICDADQPDV
jgi:hypothetical protein